MARAPRREIHRGPASAARDRAAVCRGATCRRVDCPFSSSCTGPWKPGRAASGRSDHLPLGLGVARIHSSTSFLSCSGSRGGLGIVAHLLLLHSCYQRALRGPHGLLLLSLARRTAKLRRILKQADGEADSLLVHVAAVGDQPHEEGRVLPGRPGLGVLPH
jgi:hypothetical protein